MSGIVKAIKKVVKSVVKVVKSVVKAVVDVAKSIVNFVTQPFLGMFGTPDMPSADQAAAQEQGVLITTQGSTQNIPIVYGHRKVGGTITFAETGADNNKYLWVAYALSEGPIEGVMDLYVDDYQIPNNFIPLLNNGQTVNITTGKYANRVQMQLSHGKYFDTPSDSTVGTWSIMQDSPSWKSSMIYNGIAVLFVRYEWKKIETNEDAEENPFGGSIPAIGTTLLGKKIASLTIASPDSYTYANAPTRYSTNPAEILLDYLRNPRYGKGLVNDDIDWTSWKASAAKCNTVVEHVSGLSSAIMTLNAVVPTEQTIFNNVKTLLMNFRAYMPFIQGKYKLRIEDAGNATDITSGVATIEQTFTSDDIIGSVTYSGIDRSSKYSSVSVQYVNPDNKWSMDSVIFPESVSDRQTLIDEDGGRENTLAITLGSVTNYAIAKDFAKLLLNKSRRQDSISLTVTSRAIELEVGDNIAIQNEMLTFGTDPFRIISMRYNNDMSVTLGCVANPDDIYPHTRHGEEDIVVPTYVPKGATIYYPAVQTTIPTGIIPPTNATVPVVHNPPTLVNILPISYVGAGVNSISVNGTNLQAGIGATWIGNNGTTYAATSVVVSTTNQIQVQTLASMPTTNSPYDLLVTNSSTYGSLSARINDVLTVKVTSGDSDSTPGDPIQDPPVVEDPIDDTVTPPPSDPPVIGPPITNPPPVEQEPLPLNDTAEFSFIDYTVKSDALTDVQLTFQQPENPAYDLLQVWWKRDNKNENYQYFEVKDKPGPNKDVNFTLTNLIRSSTTYAVITRVKYITGEYSTQRVRTQLNTLAAQDTATPSDSIQIVGPGWELPTEQVPSRRDNVVSELTGTFQLTGGAPKTPKEINVSFQQDTRNESANFDIVGIRVLSRAASATSGGWTVTDHVFTQPYVPGIAQTVTLTQFGAPTYPGVPTSAQQKYTVIFRFLYSDGTEATRQVRRTISTEWWTGIYTFDPFVYGMSGGKIENTADFYVEPLDPSAPAAKTSMTVAISEIPRPSKGTIRFLITPPNTSVRADWAGILFRSRKINAGTNPVLEEQKHLSTQIDTLTQKIICEFSIDHEDEYEMIITPLYYDASYNRQESQYSLLGQGYVTSRADGSDIPLNFDWTQKLGFRSMSTADAVADATKPFPAAVHPRVNVSSWGRTVLSSYAANASDNTHLELKYRQDHIADFVAVNIYRRDNFTASATSYALNGHGVGRWEKIAVTDTSSGDVTVNLRGPLSYYEFNSNFNPDNAVSSNNKLYKDEWAQKKYRGIKGTGQYMLVVETTAGESATGLLLPNHNNFSNEIGLHSLLIGQNKVSEVTVADYNNWNTALEKNINQAVTAFADSALKPSSSYWGTLADKTYITTSPVRK